MNLQIILNCLIAISIFKALGFIIDVIFQAFLEVKKQNKEQHQKEENKVSFSERIDNMMEEDRKKGTN